MAAEQAEAITEAIRGAVAEGVATKADLADLELRLTRTLYTVAAALLAGQLAAVFALIRFLG